MLRENSQIAVTHTSIYRILCRSIILFTMVQIFVCVFLNRAGMISVPMFSFPSSNASHLSSETPNGTSALPWPSDSSPSSRSGLLHPNDIPSRTGVVSRRKLPSIQASVTPYAVSRKIHRKLFQYQEETEEFVGQMHGQFPSPASSLVSDHPAQMSNVANVNFSPEGLRNVHPHHTQTGPSPGIPIYPVVMIGTPENSKDPETMGEIFALVPLSRMNEIIDSQNFANRQNFPNSPDFTNSQNFEDSPNFDDTFMGPPLTGTGIQPNLEPTGITRTRLPFSKQFWENVEDLFLVLVRTTLKTLTVVLRGLFFLLSTAGASRVADMALRTVLPQEDIVNIRGPAANTLDFIIQYIESSERLS